MGAHLRNAGWRWTSPATRGNGVELMPVNKRKYRSGKVVWSYVIDAPGSTRDNRQQITGSGFSTKRQAEDAEAERRIEEQRRHELAESGVTIATPLPTTLGMLLEEFFRQHVDEKLAPKT